MCLVIDLVISRKAREKSIGTKMADPSWDEGGAEAKAFAARAVVAGSKWDGEDEDDDVIESWEDFDEENAEEKGEKQAIESTETKPSTKKKRNLKDIIAEKEEKKRKEYEEKKQKELLEQQNMDPEDAFAEKLRRQKLQEDADLQLAKEAFGLKNDVSDAGVLESMNPSTKEEFDNYRRLLVEVVNRQEKSGFYISFLEDLFRDLCLNMEADDVKKLSSALNALGNEKVKAAKVAKGGKKKSKKATLVVGRPGDFVYDEFHGGDEYEDFM